MPSSAARAELPPGPKGHFLLGFIPEIQKRDIRMLTGFLNDYGDVIRIPVGPRSLFFLKHPDLVRLVLQDHYRFIKETRAWKMLRTILGPSVMIIAGDPWKKRRRLMQPLFNPPAISQLFPMMNRVIENMLDEFSIKESKGEPLDIRQEMMKVTLRVIGETIMGRDVAKYAEQVGASLSVILEHIAVNYSQIINWPLIIPTARNIRYRKALKVLNDLVFQCIADRRRSEKRPDDLLSRLLDATHEEDGTSLTDSEIRDEIMTMFLAGHETTASSLAWTWILLALHPDVEEKLKEEVCSDSIAWPPTMQDVQGLKYTFRVMEETLRLYPPIWAVSRSTTEQIEIGGYRIPKKATVFFSPYVLHRNPNYWDNPEQFLPDRFAPENKSKIIPYTYVPFIEGPRKCLGYHFALIESPLIIASIARNFRLTLPSHHLPKPHFSTTLRPEPGVLMRLEKR